MNEKEVIDRLVRWANEQPLVRALLLTSSRANPGALLDRFSDYDVIVAVADIHPFSHDETWLRGYGCGVAKFHPYLERVDMVSCLNQP